MTRTKHSFSPTDAPSNRGATANWRLAATVALSVTTVVGALSLAPGCNDHVFVVVDGECERTLEQGLVIAENIHADILLVVDNSGSMCEEQDNLARNFFDPNCPITDLNNVQPEYRNPNNDTVAELAQNCGFIQLLAAYDNDFRVGVISTDVGECDNRFLFAAQPEIAALCGGQVFPNWGRRPQRGCLQAPPGAERKYIQKGDTDIGDRFNETIANIQTFGSPFERGLDAMEVFLDPNSNRAAGCEDDRNAFIRNNAELIVIFLSDENDCSHADGEYGFTDENAGEGCDASNPEIAYGNRDPSVDSRTCYDNPELLAPIDRYVDFLKGVKGPGQEARVSTAVIAGAVRNANGVLESSGCIPVNGSPNDQCRNSGGLSIYTSPGSPCDPANGGACCAADPGTRYFQFADRLGNSLTDSICYDSFRQTMVNIAQFIAAEDVLILTEPPKNPRDIHVYLCGNDAEELADCTSVPRIGDGEDPTGRNGWQLAGDRIVQAYGTGIPQPGQELKVFASAARTSETGPCSGAGGTDAGTSN